MSITLDPTTGITAPAASFTTPLPITNGGTGSSTISPYQMVLATAQATTSGTSIDFTGIPSWVKKITVMLSGVSTNGTSPMQLQIGAGSVDATSTYVGNAWRAAAASNSYSPYTTGFILLNGQAAAGTYSGVVSLNLRTALAYLFSGIMGRDDAINEGHSMMGTKTLSGAIDRIRLTTVNGTDTFDAGSVNIMYEGSA